MRLHELRIKNFRKLKDCRVQFRDATFLIGPNNTGKSSLFQAINYLHRATNVNKEDFSKTYSEEEGGFVYEHEIEVVAEYRNLPPEADGWVGFKGRVIRIDSPLPGETDLAITYRKVWVLDKSKPDISILEYPRSVSPSYESCEKVEDLVGSDYSLEFIQEHFGASNLGKKLSVAAVSSAFSDLPACWEVDQTSTPTWVQNPGGIPGNVLSRLPRVVVVPAESCSTELTSSTGALFTMLTELFNQVRTASDNYRQAQVFLNNLAEEMDPADGGTNFGQLLEQLNGMTHRLFPDSAVHVAASLDQPEKTLKPNFDVQMESNVRTSVNYQGHGMIRATAFQLLRYVHDFTNKQLDLPRTTIFCFEEPEIFLHPSAANQMREAIYDLAGPGCQIVATTHSPYMVNLGSDKDVSLCKFSLLDDGFANSHPLNLNAAFQELKSDEKKNLKLLLKADDYISRMFFAKKSVFVEGDTEEVVIRETLARLSPERRARVIGNIEFLRARGKPVLISIAKYLNALGLDYHILHDRDGGTIGADVVNQAIADESGEGRRTILEECIEDVLGYEAPSSEKPFKAYQHIAAHWADEFDNLPATWRNKFTDVCRPYI